MKYKLIHLDAGILAESNRMYVLQDLRELYISRNVKPEMLVIAKESGEEE